MLTNYMVFFSHSMTQDDPVGRLGNRDYLPEVCSRNVSYLSAGKVAISVACGCDSRLPYHSWWGT